MKKGIPVHLTNLISDIFDRGAEAPLDLLTERLTVAASQAGDSAATERLVLAYASALRNGVSIFVRALPTPLQGADLEDVRQNAIVGFLEAVRAFDLEKHDRLAAIAPAYIRKEVAASAASATGFSIPARTLNRVFGILRAANGNVFEAAALAPSYEMKTETFLAAIDALRNVTSFDSLSGSGDDDTATGPEVNATPLWDGQHADAEDRILVEAAFRAMDTLERDVTRLAYGFSEFDPVPDAEIGHRLGFSRPKVQRTRAGALAKARTALGVA